MVRKCSVGGCKSNYSSQRSEQPNTITVYGFPKDQDERAKWLASIPNKIKKVSENMGVCAKHFPPDVPMYRCGPHLLPSVPPSVFYNVPPSCIPTPQSQPRSTEKSSSTVRARTGDVDEMPDFQLIDRFGSPADFFRQLVAHFPSCGVSVTGDTFYIMSQKRNGAVHDFSVYGVLIHESENDETPKVSALHVEVYRKLKRVSHPLLKKNTVSFWSQLEEVVRFASVDSDELDPKEEFILHQIEFQNTPRNCRLYKVEDLCLGLKWLTRSKSLYTEVRKCVQLPSVTTLSRVTRTAKNTQDETLYRNVFGGLEERKRACAIIIDEVYVKASLTYRGGVLFGYAMDEPDKKATTLLCVMVKCMFGGPKFLAKLIPCAGLKATFQFTVVSELICTLEKCGARVLAAINDNNRLNQAFFKMFRPMYPSSPWAVYSPCQPPRPLFLLYDPVHVLKNIRNIWISEATKTLQIPTADGSIQAKWSDLDALHRSEASSMLKLSKLTKAPVAPSSVEKQKVSLVLEVFSDETSSALKTSSHKQPSWEATARFIDAVVKLWKVFNCKSPLQDARRRDPDRLVVDLTEKGAKAIETLSAGADLADSLHPRTNNAPLRMRTLTRDTAEALAWTCRCLRDLSKFLLEVNSPYKHSYVCLGFFLQDDLERHFGYFRMSAGSNYYLTAHDILSIHAKDQARMMLKNMQDVEYLVDSSHRCDLCTKDLTDSELLVLDDLAESTEKLKLDEQQAAFYIAGYVASKHKELSGSPAESSASVQAFMEDLNRGGLTYPSRQLFNLTLLAYCFFKQTPEHFCRNRLTRILDNFPATFHLEFSMPAVALKRLANLLLKRLCLYSRQEETNMGQSNRKIAKLSSTKAQ